jgi:hypothetical protein
MTCVVSTMLMICVASELGIRNMAFCGGNTAWLMGCDVVHAAQVATR